MMSGLRASVHALSPCRARFRLLLSSTAGSFLLLSSLLPAQAQTVWIGGTGDWFVPGNWSNGVPIGGQAADVSNGGTAQINAAANAGLLSVLNSSRIVLQTGSSLTASSIFLGSGPSGGILEFTRTDNVTISAPISGSGRVKISNTIGSVAAYNATTTFTSANTYSGGTSVGIGTLSIDADSELGDVNGAVSLDGGSLRFTGAVTSPVTRTYSVTVGSGLDVLADSSIAGNLSGNFVVKTGNAMLTLTGDVSLTALDISAGTVRIGNGGTAGSLTGNASLFAGTIIFDRSDTITYAGDISGNSGAQIVQAGAGTLVLTGNASLGILINSGTVQVGDGGTTGRIGGAVVNGTLVFDRSDTQSYTGDFTGTGTLVQAGSGTIQILGTTNVANGVVIQSGTLQLADTQNNVTDNGALILAPRLSALYSGVISGTGSVTIAEAVTFTNSNTYTGGTIINTGERLRIGNAGITGSLAGNVAGLGTLDFNRTDSTSFAGVISGSVAVEVERGTVILTGSSTYAGQTTVDSGSILRAGAANAFSTASEYFTNSSQAIIDLAGFDQAVRTISGFGAVQLGSATLTVGGGAGTFSGSISGTGNLVEAGPGVFILSGANTATGVTTITAGTLRLASGTFSQGTINNALVIVSGTLDVTAVNARVGSLSGTGGSITLGAGSNLTTTSSADTTLSSVISGTGRLIKGGAGKITLTAANSYSGGTTLNGGTVAITTDGNLGAANGPLTFTGGALAIGADVTLAIGRTITLQSTGTFDTGQNTLTIGQAIIGPGSLIEQGQGLLVLAGANTYSGHTTIGSGSAVQIGNGGTTGSIVGAVDSIGTLIFNRSNAFSFSGVISNTGAVTQAGTGTTTLSGVNTYTGSTTVNDGTLAVNGSIGSSAVTVNSGGTLGGTGTVGSTAVQSGGVLAPGNSVGTLNVSGTLTLAAGSTMVVEVDPSVSDKVVATGAVNIAGQLFVNFAAGTYTAKQYTIISTAGVLSGSFSSFDSLGLPLGFAETVTYDTHDAFLNLVVADTIWKSTPGSSDWNTGVNWLTNAVPGSSDTAKFQATTVSSIDIRQATSIASLQFGTATPTYTFNITGSAGSAASLTIGGLGIVDAPSNAPTFNVSGVAANGGTLTFANAAIAGDARITAGAFGTVAFTGTSDAGPSAQLIAAAGGTVDFSGTTGSANDKNVSAGSIAGAGSFKLGGDRLSVGANNASTEVSGVIADGGTAGGSGASLVKVGTGTLILSGANAYTAGTTISAGTLQLGNGGTSGSIAGNVTDNATFAFTRSDAVSFGGVISGSGAVVQAGTGTTTLTASNTYSGGTAVSAGALQIGNGGTVGAIAGNVLDNASLIFNRSDAVTFGGVISGTGSVTLAGSGATTFTAANTYNGGTMISAGALQLITGGDIAGDVIDNALLLFNRSGTNTFGGAISGSGALTQAQGTLILTGASSYTGATTIATGATVQLGNGATGALAGPIVDNGVFDIHHSNDVIVPSAISGSGALVQSGSGKAILTGSDSYTGGTTISAGALQLGNGGTSGSIAGNVTDNATLIFNRTDTITFAGVISGTGGLTHNGTGTTVLTGIDTYSGPTIVNAGVLDVNGSIANSAVTTNGGGVVKGNGTLGSISLAPGAHIAPGNSIGTLAIAGGITFAAGTTYDVEADAAGAADRINAGGAATILGGTVAIAAAPGIYTGLTYRILSATGGVSGSFTGLTTGSPSLIARLFYGPTTVDLFLVSDIDFTPLTHSANEAATAAAVKAGGAASTLYNAFLMQQPNTAFIPAALDQLSGTLHPDLRGAMLQDSRAVRQALLGRLRQATSGGSGPDSRDVADGVTAWLRVLSGWGSIDGDGNAAMLDQANSGILGGIDARLADDLRAGLAGGYTHSNVNTDAHSASATSGNGHIAGYAGWSDGALKLRAAAAYGWGNASTLRAVQFPGFSNTLTGKQGEHATQAFAEIGDSIDGSWFAFEPFAGINWVQAGTGGFAESGGAAALSGNGGTSTETYTSLGLRFSGESPAVDGFAVTPHIALSWEHAIGSLHPRDTVTFLATAQSFATLGVPLDSDALSTEAGIDIQITPRGRIGLGYDGFLSGGARNNAVRADLSWEF